MIGAFSKTELATLLQSLNRGMNQKAAKEDYEALMGWAEAARLDADLLELILAGHIDPYVDAEGVLKFMPTPKGLDGARKHELERMRT